MGTSTYYINSIFVFVLNKYVIYYNLKESVLGITKNAHV